MSGQLGVSCAFHRLHIDQSKRSSTVSNDDRSRRTVVPHIIGVLPKFQIGSGSQSCGVIRTEHSVSSTRDKNSIEIGNEGDALWFVQTSDASDPFSLAEIDDLHC